MDMVDFFSVETQKFYTLYSVLRKQFTVVSVDPEPKRLFIILFSNWNEQKGILDHRVLVSQLGPFKPLTYTDKADSELFLRSFHSHGCPLFCSNLQTLLWFRHYVSGWSRLLGVLGWCLEVYMEEACVFLSSGLALPLSL